MDKVIMHCDVCEKDFEQELEYISQVEWKCSICGTQLWMKEYIEEKPVDKEIKLGNGGALHA